MKTSQRWTVFTLKLTKKGKRERGRKRTPPLQLAANSALVLNVLRSDAERSTLRTNADYRLDLQDKAEAAVR